MTTDEVEFVSAIGIIENNIYAASESLIDGKPEDALGYVNQAKIHLTDVVDEKIAGEAGRLLDILGELAQPGNKQTEEHLKQAWQTFFDTLRALESETKEKFMNYHIVVTTSTLNRQWNDAFKNIDRIDALAENASANLGKIIHDYSVILRAHTSGLRLRVDGQSKEDQELGLTYYQQAKDSLEKIIDEHPEFGNLPAVKGMLLTLNLPPKSTLEGETDQSRIPPVQRARQMSEIIEIMKHESNPLLDEVGGIDYMEAVANAISAWPEIVSRIKESVHALSRMDLEIAERYIVEANVSLKKVEQEFAELEVDLPLLQAPGNVFRATNLFFDSQELYIKTLHHAITNDVTSHQINALRDAEKNLFESKGLFENWAALLPGVTDNQVSDLNEAIDSQREINSNLKRLCEQSLHRKEIAVSSLPKFVVYFLAVFIIILFALPLSGMINELDFQSVLILLIISFAASLIATLGFGALRFTEWLEILFAAVRTLYT